MPGWTGTNGCGVEFLNISLFRRLLFRAPAKSMTPRPVQEDMVTTDEGPHIIYVDGEGHTIHISDKCHRNVPRNNANGNGNSKGKGNVDLLAPPSIAASSSKPKMDSTATAEDSSIAWQV